MRLPLRFVSLAVPRTLVVFVMVFESPPLFFYVEGLALGWEPNVGFETVWFSTKNCLVVEIQGRIKLIMIIREIKTTAKSDTFSIVSHGLDAQPNCCSVQAVYSIFRDFQLTRRQHLSQGCANKVKTEKVAIKS